MGEPQQLASAPLLLGEALISRGLITTDQFIDAIVAQDATGSRLGSVMIAAGMVSRLQLHQVLAEEWGLPFVDLTDIEPDRRLLDRFDPKRLAEQGWFPVEGRWSADELRSVLIATAEPPGQEAVAAIQAEVGVPIEVAITTDWDVGHALRAGYRDQLLDEASHGLWRKNQDQSARTVLGANQRVGMIVFAIVVMVLTIFYPRMAIIVAIAAANLAFIASVGFKFVVCLVGARRERDEGITPEQVAELDDVDLPFYTVLVPVYNEANIVADLVDNLGDLDYPAAKLEILLLMEEDDPETIAAAQAADAPSTMVFITIPDGLPKTKPKACNVGLFFARGEHVVIYDAEDKPDVDQLLVALAAFQDPDNADVLVVQGALDYWNDEQNWITRMFALEYAWWFQCMLPGLSQLGVPIPLGGTSNHFRTDVLRQLHGWDGYNVTEDADLGIRAAAHGWRVSIIPSMTKEEANSQAWNFVRQRSRWIKGYMMTALVRTRHPVDLFRTVGIRGFASFVFLIAGTPFTFLVTPILWLLFLLSVTLSPAWLDSLFQGPWGVLAAVNLFVINAVVGWLNLMACTYENRSKLVWWAFLNPFYWMLHSTASYMALYELIVKPHFWQKTNHGLAGHDADD